MFYNSTSPIKKYLSTALIAMAISLPTSVYAAFSIDQNLIQSYKNKVSSVQTLEKRAQTTLQCVTDRKSDVITTLQSLEVSLGKLRQEEQTYNQKFAEKSTQIKLQKQTLDQESKNLAALKRKKTHLQNKKRAEERDIAACKKEWWTIDVTCEWAGELAKLLGLMDNVDNDLAVATKKHAGAESRYTKTHKEYRDIQIELKNTKNQLNKITPQIKDQENDIAELKKQSSILSNHIQSSQKLIDESNDTLASALDINTEDEKKRTVRQITRLSNQLDKIAQTSPTTIQQAATVLAAQGATCL